MRTTIFLLLAIWCSTVYAGPFCPEETNVCTSNTCKGTEKEILGTHTWYLLHKIAETVPPTPQNRRYFGHSWTRLLNCTPAQSAANTCRNFYKPSSWTSHLLDVPISQHGQPSTGQTCPQLLHLPIKYKYF